jgi:choline dehydrogenase-like flavoprotein
VLAGGAFGTTKMLLQSGFKKQLPALGKNFSTHPQFMSFGLFNEEIHAYKGYFQTVASKDPILRQKGYKLENVFAPPISAAMLFSRTGAYHQEIMRNYTRMTCIEVAVRDENAGEIKVDNKGKLTIDKPFTAQDRRRRDEGRELIANILTNEGAKKVYASPFSVGLHLMGGSVMGTNSAKSVVDPEFRVHGYKNMFVADSSIYPNAPGINPSLTIMALAQKLSDQLIVANHGI